MAVYTKLLLSAGGGIISVQQQADQEPNTASVLIGLGGTGVDCLRTIKTQVYSRLKPDDPQSIIPTYEHIRFLGVDTDQKSHGDVRSDDGEKANSLRALDQTEYFNIANGNVKKDLSNELALNNREELDWLRHREVKNVDLTVAGAGGIRQVGRYMLMDKSDVFLSRIEQEINKAKSGLVTPKVNVHIFSGLSGGTGAGTFLDVCYMVRSIAKRMGGVTIFGYFFLPDVNLSRISFKNTKVRSYIPRNGYASMQELDYCMNLQYNGGSFAQMYKGRNRIEWKEPPVDLCHLICATDTNNNVIPNAYEYAMNVTAEYLMDFLTKSKDFTLESQLANFTQCVTNADGDKKYGVNMAYCVIGASCASLPLREINTYLASELFGKFVSVGEHTPTQKDVEDLAVKTMGNLDSGNVNEIYGRLVIEMQDGFDFNFSDWGDDWRYALNGGGYNDDCLPHYTNQYNAKRGIAEKNARSMSSDKNERSLIGRLRMKLAEIIRDVNRGPLFAHKMLSAAETHNMLNIIDGLIEENRGRHDQDDYNRPAIRKAYERAHSDFFNRHKRSLMDNDRKRFADLKAAMVAERSNVLAIFCYDLLDGVLREFRKQVEEADAQYYARLARLTSTLSQTFRENHDALEGEREGTVVEAFSMPLMTIDELKPSMDAEIEKISVPGMFDALMGDLLANDAEWLQEDENKICRIVTKFFVERAFGDFASRSITSFLKDKYQTTNDEDLTNKVYNEWMVKLVAKAHPLFYFNSAIYSENDTSKIAFLSVPETSAPVQNAAERMHAVNDEYEVKISSLTDRIFVMCSSAVLPLSAYSNCDEYEQLYFSSTASPGSHYYEGKEIPGMLFNDWRKLPPLTPQQLVHMDLVPYQVRENVRAGRDLFDRAEAAGLFDEERQILRPSEASLRLLDTAVEECERVAASLSSPDQIAGAQLALENLEIAGSLQMEPTGERFQNDGRSDTPEVRRRVFLDHFVASPAYQLYVRRILGEVDAAHERAGRAKATLEQQIEKVGIGNRDVADYIEALFTGVISLEGRTVMYHRTEHGINTDITLAKRGPEFPYGALPVFQGFVTYKGLDPRDKAQVKAKVEKLYNDDSPQIVQTGERLRGELTDDRINAWAQLAASFPIRAEIVEFIGALRDKFRLFCLENGIV